jgi:tetratricopeptide (TPR) repeat protein
MPEAVEQATKNMVKTGTSVSEYLEEFKETEDGTENRDISTTTWLMSFEKIRETNSESANLLSLMTYLDCNGIPQSILHEYKNKYKPEHLEWDFRAACGCLKAFSMLEDIKMDRNEGEQEEGSINNSPTPIQTLNNDGREQVSGKFGQKADEKLVFVPRMVHDHVQRWLQNHDESGIWIGRAIGTLLEVFQAPEDANWRSYELYVPHVMAAINHVPPHEQVSDDVATLLDCISRYYRIRGYHSSAETYGREALRIRKSLLGDKSLNPETIASITNVSQILFKIDHLSEAEELQQPVEDVCRNRLGMDKRETIDGLRHLASIRRMHGQLEEAEELQRQVVKASETHFGNNSIHTLRGNRDLAITYGRQGRHKEALALQVRVFEGFKRILGEYHPETLIVMSDLAEIHAWQYHLKEAEGLFRRLAHTSHKVLGSEHPHTKRAWENFEDMQIFQGVKNETDELKQSWDRYCHGSRLTKPDGTLLSPIRRSMSDTVATIQIYRKQTICRSQTFREGLPSTRNAAKVSDGAAEPFEKLTERVLELSKEISSGVSNCKVGW